MSSICEMLYDIGNTNIHNMFLHLHYVERICCARRLSSPLSFSRGVLHISPLLQLFSSTDNYSLHHPQLSLLESNLSSPLLGNFITLSSLQSTWLHPASLTIILFISVFSSTLSQTVRILFCTSRLLFIIIRYFN